MEAKARLVSTVMAPEHWWKSRSRKLSCVDVDVTGRCSHCRRVTCDRRAFPLRRTGGDREARHQQEEETKTYHRRRLTACGSPAGDPAARRIDALTVPQSVAGAQLQLPLGRLRPAGASASQAPTRRSSPNTVECCTDVGDERPKVEHSILPFLDQH